MISFINWLLSSKVREARQMSGHARKILEEQRDQLNPQAIQAMEESIATLKTTFKTQRDAKTISSRMADLESTATKWLKPYPYASYRENVEVFLVAIAVAMGIRTFFLQPFKIPTGSMQPTLYGVTADNFIGDSNFKMPGMVEGWMSAIFQGASYYHVVAKNSGALSIIDSQPTRFIFNLTQKFRIGEDVYTVWWPPDNFFRHAGLVEGMMFQKGQDVIKMRAVSGDHLFVDRVSYNFRRPHRGDIVVFQTVGIRGQGMTDDQHYIKRLIGLPGESVQIGDDRHVVINGKRLDKTTPHFEKVYDEENWKDGGYLGHVNGRVRPLGMSYFEDASYTFKIPSNHYLVMGDNTLNSSDSRYWGSFPTTNVIGKSFFVYWPFNKRFGWWGHD